MGIPFSGTSRRQTEDLLELAIDPSFLHIRLHPQNLYTETCTQEMYHEDHLFFKGGMPYSIGIDGKTAFKSMLTVLESKFTFRLDVFLLRLPKKSPVSGHRSASKSVR